MSKDSIAQTVRRLTEPVARECGVSIWDVQYLKEGPNRVLRITIDRPEGIDSDTCYHFTELANPVIDRADPIAESYMFEVSSPGLGRKLRTPEHFEKSAGRQLRVRLIRPAGGKREFSGTLSGYSAGKVTLSTSEGELEFDTGDAAFIKYDDDNF